jgi:hypothetical protein
MALTAPRLRALHRAEDIGSAFKRGVNVCQRELVNEVLGPLVTEFVRNFGREGATPIQRGPNASLFGRVQAIKLISHNALPDIWSRPTEVGRLFSAPGSTLRWQYGFVVGGLVLANDTPLDTPPGGPVLCAGLQVSKKTLKSLKDSRGTFG